MQTMESTSNRNVSIIIIINSKNNSNYVQTIHLNRARDIEEGSINKMATIDQLTIETMDED